MIDCEAGQRRRDPSACPRRLANQATDHSTLNGWPADRRTTFENRLQDCFGSNVWIGITVFAFNDFTNPLKSATSMCPLAWARRNSRQVHETSGTIPVWKKKLIEIEELYRNASLGEV